MGKRSGLGVPERREAVLSLVRRDERDRVIGELTIANRLLKKGGRR